MKTSNYDRSMMERYGITCEQESLYYYKSFQYGNLQDAVNFAILEGDRKGKHFTNKHKSAAPVLQSGKRE
ncbi:hypothetical protein SAMN02745866_03148 [Alteromonadaceae bacterium Bs31]|nr:hypothetical protein SAMN02745866_03148 [Alteromonadaceae bacterium Bs31]